MLTTNISVVKKVDKSFSSTAQQAVLTDILVPKSSTKVRPTTMDKNNEKNDKFYRKVAYLMYTEMDNFRPQS